MLINLHRSAGGGRLLRRKDTAFYIICQIFAIVFAHILTNLTLFWALLRGDNIIMISIEG